MTLKGSSSSKIMVTKSKPLKEKIQGWTGNTKRPITYHIADTKGSIWPIGTKVTHLHLEPTQSLRILYSLFAQPLQNAHNQPTSWSLSTIPEDDWLTEEKNNSFPLGWGRAEPSSNNSLMPEPTYSFWLCRSNSRFEAERKEEPSEQQRWDTQVCLEWSLKSGIQMLLYLLLRDSELCLWFWSSFRN